jgi:intracellular multiplication protein IcmJ
LAKSNIPLAIGLNADQWPIYAKREIDPAFNKVKASACQRDRHICQYCDFQSIRHMDVANLDGNYKNNQLANLITACPFCMQCHFLHMAGKTEKSGGKIIFLPNVTQSQLNALCHVLFCAIVNGTSYAQEAQNTLNQLRLRSNKVDTVLGKGLSEPSMLGQMLLDTPIKKNKAEIIHATLKDLRLLPSMKKFERFVGQWSKEALTTNASKPGISG